METATSSVGTLRYGSKVYLPRLGALEERTVTKVESTEYGIYVRLEHSATMGPAAFISNKICNGHMEYYVKKEDALAVQREMRTKELKRLQENAGKALSELNLFTNLYFNAI